MKMFIPLFIVCLLIGWVNGNMFSGLTKNEPLSSVHYGQKVDVGGGVKMSVNITGENNEPTIVFLPGLGMIAPVYHYKALTDALSDKYKIVSVEPIGYGLSDISEKDRTIENIVEELHTCFQKLGLKKFYFMAHSLGGLYGLGYANKYPNELLGMIGLDSSVPTQYDIPSTLVQVSAIYKQNEILYFVGNIMKKTGLLNVMKIPGRSIDDFVANSVDPTNNYTEEEMKNIRTIVANRYVSYDSFSESHNAIRNFQYYKGKKFPESVPVLNILASDTNDNAALGNWEEEHKELITNTDRSEVIILKGSHAIYIDQKEEVIKKIKSWAI